MTPTLRPSLRHLARLAIPAAPIALASAPRLCAQIVYTNLGDITIHSSGSSPSLYVDLGTNGGPGTASFTRADIDSGAVDFVMLYLSKPANNGSLIFNYNDARLVGDPTHAAKLAINDPIGSGSTFIPTDAGYLTYNTDWHAGSGGTSGYLGIKFEIGTQSTPKTGYGWLYVTLGNDGTDYITLHSFAYESSGGTILAGDTGVAIPEPSATPLFAGLTALAAGSVALYRRRKSVPPAPAAA